MAILFQSLQHLSPATAVIGFAVTLVLSLVAAEEVELRRGPATASEDAHG